MHRWQRIFPSYRLWLTPLNEVLSSTGAVSFHGVPFVHTCFHFLKFWSLFRKFLSMPEPWNVSFSGFRVWVLHEGLWWHCTDFCAAWETGTYFHSPTCRTPVCQWHSLRTLLFLQLLWFLPLARSGGCSYMGVILDSLSCSVVYMFCFTLTVILVWSLSLCGVIVRKFVVMARIIPFRKCFV